MPRAVIAAYARSPFHFAHKGALAGTRPDDICAAVVAELVRRAGIDPQEIEDLIVGCSFPEGEQGNNIGRLVALRAGLPHQVAGATVNRYCGSSMSAVHMAAGAIAMGAGEAFLCAGVESMTRVPQGGFNRTPNPALMDREPGAYMPMGVTAENVARLYQIPRADQEAFAIASHAKAAAARADGRLAAEIVPILTADGAVREDGCIRPGTSPAALANLKPAFDPEGSVTAGTSSPLTDGASAVLICSEAFAHARGLAPIAVIRASAVAGCAPELMGLGPIPAARKALARAGLSAADLDVVELNEAFASQALACIRDLSLDPATVNRDGGALALGHPLGATGARITGKAAALLRSGGGRYALATQCIGGGQGIATVLEAA